MEDRVRVQGERMLNLLREIEAEEGERGKLRVHIVFFIADTFFFSRSRGYGRCVDARNPSIPDPQKSE